MIKEERSYDTPQQIFETTGDIKKDLVKLKKVLKTHPSKKEDFEVYNNYLIAITERFTRLILKWRKYAKNALD